MKVCKVVFNSVSHDARVLKEAKAISEVIEEVVIIGIQDANNHVPIEKDGNILIRRSAWKSDALKPYSWVYFLKIVFYLLLSFMVFYFAYEIIENYNLYFTYMIRNIENFILLSIGFFVLAYSFKKAKITYEEYKKRKKTYESLKTKEKDELLKYTLILDNVEIDKKSLRKKPKEKVKSVTFIKEVSRDNLIKYLPRPFMMGVLNALNIKNIKTWKTILSREKAIFNILCEEKPDIIHAHDLTALPVCAKYKRKYGCKLVFDAHELYDHLAQSEADMSKMNKKILLKYSKDVDLFITINDSIANYYKRFYPRLPEPVIIKNATVLAEEISYDGRLHKAAKISNDKKILLYQGGFAPKRGLLQLLMSAEYLKDDWVLVFMGWGNLQKEMRLLYTTLLQRNKKIEEKVKFLPKVKQKELPYWTTGATLGVIPYENTSLNHWFCTPNKLWEYPNAAVPILASPFPELKKTIEENNIGYFLPDPLNPKDIAEIVNGLDDDELKMLRKNCREFIKRDNWSKYANILQYQYRGLK